MIILCENCSRKFNVQDKDIPREGRMVRCGYCSVSWHQMPVSSSHKASYSPQARKKTKISKSTQIIDDSPSVDSIKASDGKTYKFLGSQWAELLPSGKTGLFARKKISQELDEVTGRKENKTEKKRKKRLEEVDPSTGALNNAKEHSNASKAKQGIGFFGYLFLLIIVGFSLVGIMKTFEDDFINSFPEAELLYIFLDEQLEFLAESVKNIIVIIKDLINSY